MRTILLGGVVKEVDRVGWAMNATVVFNQAGRIPALARKDLAVRLVSQDGAFDVVHILPWKGSFLQWIRLG